MAKRRDFEDPKRLVLWNMRLPAETLERLRERAEELGLSASWLARKFISEGLDRKKSIT